MVQSQEQNKHPLTDAPLSDLNNDFTSIEGLRDTCGTEICAWLVLGQRISGISVAGTDCFQRFEGSNTFIELLGFRLKFLHTSHCVKSVRIRSYSGPYLSLRIQSECGKIRTRITSNTDTFRAASSLCRVTSGHTT